MSSDRICPSCGASHMVKFFGETHEFGHGDFRQAVSNLSGEKCLQCEEAIYSDESDKVIFETLNSFSKKREGEFIKNVRKNKLKITQNEAVRVLSGGGHNAFSRYEKGEVSPPKSLLVLMQLINKNPSIYEEIKKLRV